MDRVSARQGHRRMTPKLLKTKTSRTSRPTTTTTMMTMNGAMTTMTNTLTSHMENRRRYLWAKYSSRSKMGLPKDKVPEVILVQLQLQKKRRK